MWVSLVSCLLLLRCYTATGLLDSAVDMKFVVVCFDFALYGRGSALAAHLGPRPDPYRLLLLVSLSRDNRPCHKQFGSK
jgi:hypothetical protein